jgi:hypothetical protein
LAETSEWAGWMIGLRTEAPLTVGPCLTGAAAGSLNVAAGGKDPCYRKFNNGSLHGSFELVVVSCSFWWTLRDRSASHLQVTDLIQFLSSR